MMDEKDKVIAYEMSMLLKENRAMRDQIENLKNMVKSQDEQVASLEHRIDLIMNEKREKRLTEQNCKSDLDLKRGDRVVVTECREGNVICKGFVVEVKNPPYEHVHGYYNLGCYRLNEDGTRKAGAGAVMTLSSESQSWRKVEADTPLTIYRKVVVGTHKDRHGWGYDVNEYEYEYDNLLNIE